MVGYNDPYNRMVTTKAMKNIVSKANMVDRLNGSGKNDPMADFDDSEGSDYESDSDVLTGGAAQMAAKLFAEEDEQLQDAVEKTIEPKGVMEKRAAMDLGAGKCRGGKSIWSYMSEGGASSQERMELDLGAGKSGGAGALASVFATALPLAIQLLTPKIQSLMGSGGKKALKGMKGGMTKYLRANLPHGMKGCAAKCCAACLKHFKGKGYTGAGMVGGNGPVAPTTESLYGYDNNEQGEGLVPPRNVATGGPKGLKGGSLPLHQGYGKSGGAVSTRRQAAAAAAAAAPVRRTRAAARAAAPEPAPAPAPAPRRRRMTAAEREAAAQRAADEARRARRRKPRSQLNRCGIAGSDLANCRWVRVFGDAGDEGSGMAGSGMVGGSPAGGWHELIPRDNLPSNIGGAKKGRGRMAKNGDYIGPSTGAIIPALQSKQYQVGSGRSGGAIKSHVMPVGWEYKKMQAAPMQGSAARGWLPTNVQRGDKMVMPHEQGEGGAMCNWVEKPAGRRGTKWVEECEGSGMGERTVGGARSARAAIVKQVMAEKGLSMIDASKYVKQHGLYKGAGRSGAGACGGAYTANDFFMPKNIHQFFGAYA